MPRQSYAVQKAKIEKEIEKLKKQAQALQSKKRLPVIRSIIKTMKEYDITTEEIVQAFGKGTKPRATVKRATRAPVPVKYRHPQTGQTWTGRGKAPRWVTEAEAAGQSRTTFLVANT
jgi:DNA-binding protein H-NS